METAIQECVVDYQFHKSDVPDAPVILLLHGWGCNQSTLSFLADSLVQAGASVLTLDFPGHGKSAEPPVPWGVAEYARMVEMLLSQLKLCQVSIVAHSFGARVALFLAAKRPAIIYKLVITGGAGIKKPISEAQEKRTTRYKRYSHMLEMLCRVPLLGSVAQRGKVWLRNRYGSADYVRLSEGMRGTFVKVISQDLHPLLSLVKASTLLVWGSEDTETPLWMGEEMERQIPDAGLVIFEGRGHFAFADEWQRFVIIVKNFLMEGA